MRQNKRIDVPFQIFTFLFTLIICYMITAVGILGLAYLLLVFQFPIETTDSIIYCIYCGSVLGGVFHMEIINNREMKIQGLVLGASYSCFLFWVASCLDTEFQIWEEDHVFVFFITTLIGGLGEYFCKIRGERKKNKGENQYFH